jgi:hypothetical protein
MAEPLQQQQQQQQRQQQQQPAVPLPASPLLPDAVDMHHRAFFSFEPSLLLADLGNIVSVLSLWRAPAACRQRPLVTCCAAPPAAAAAAAIAIATHTACTCPAGAGLLHIRYSPAGAVSNSTICSVAHVCDRRACMQHATALCLQLLAWHQTTSGANQHQRAAHI